MTDDAEKIARLMAILEAAYPNANIREGTIDLWAGRFGRFKLEHLERTAARWIDAEKWFPSIAEFKALLERVTGLDQLVFEQPYHVPVGGIQALSERIHAEAYDRHPGQGLGLLGEGFGKIEGGR